jgi:hypothetical protein
MAMFKEQPRLDIRAASWGKNPGVERSFCSVEELRRRRAGRLVES